MKILVAMPTEKEHIEKLKAACPEGEFVFLNGAQPTDEQLSECEIIIGKVPVKDLDKCRKLKFMQLNMAGSDLYAGKMPKGVLLANASGAYGLAISEHLLGTMLSLMKKLYLYRDNQQSAFWHDEGDVVSVSGARVLTVGLGDIGGQFAEKCKALGAYCIGIRRNIREKPAYMDEMYTLDALDELIPTADVITLALPNNAQSFHLMNEKRLNAMKQGAVLLNVGRGTAIDTDALVKVLNAKHILAGIDVTDPEPLPPEHPLWKCPGIIITPHVSGFYHLRHTHDTIIEIACENIRNFIDGKPLKNLVDEKTGYRRQENRFSDK